MDPNPHLHLRVIKRRIFTSIWPILMQQKLGGMGFPKESQGRTETEL